jgi:hypothetical protein
LLLGIAVTVGAIALWVTYYVARTPPKVSFEFVFTIMKSLLLMAIAALVFFSLNSLLS